MKKYLERQWLESQFKVESLDHSNYKSVAIILLLMRLLSEKHKNKSAYRCLRWGWLFLLNTINFMAQPNSKPIIIMGNQKTGSSAIAMLLGKMTGKSVTVDLRGIYEPILSQLYNKRLKWDKFVKRNRIDFSRDVIKEPWFILFYNELRTFFPDSPFVFIQRDPRSNIRSILNRVNLTGKVTSEDKRKSSQLSLEWERVINANWMGMHGKTYIESLAHRWNFAADVYLNNKSEFELVKYEDFITDKIRVIQELVHKLGLKAIYDITEVADKQYQPAGKADVSWYDFFGEENLDLINHICGSRMSRFGYTAE